MELYAKIEKIFINQKEMFCEFLTCLYNNGMSEMFFDYRDDLNFCFHRYNASFGINDLFVYFEDYTYFNYILEKYNNVSIAYIITPLHFETEKFRSKWNISYRRQFYKDKSSYCSCSKEYVQLNKSHASIINSSTSNNVISNYNNSMDLEEKSFAFLCNELQCFLSTCKIEKANMLEVSWIYTEPKYRNKGYASALLNSISNLYAANGILITYHCSKDNVASANTALKSGFKETRLEIVLERKQA